MSAYGTKRTSHSGRRMFAFGGKAARRAAPKAIANHLPNGVGADQPCERCHTIPEALQASFSAKSLRFLQRVGLRIDQRPEYEQAPHPGADVSGIRTPRRLGCNTAVPCGPQNRPAVRRRPRRGRGRVCGTGRPSRWPGVYRCAAAKQRCFSARYRARIYTGV